MNITEYMLSDIVVGCINTCNLRSLRALPSMERFLESKSAARCGRMLHPEQDFITYWTAGQQLVHGANPYDDTAILPLERLAEFPRNHALIMRNHYWSWFV